MSSNQDNLKNLTKTKAEIIANKNTQNLSLLRMILSVLQYPTIFLVIYLAINWYRMPEIPADLSLEMTDYQGEVIDLQAMSEQSPVLVYFWGSWCGACRPSTSKVSQLSQEGYPVVTIAVESGDNKTLTSYLLENQLNFTTINDSTGELFDNWQGQVTPSFVIFNKGKVTQGMTGVQPLWSLKLRMWVSNLDQ